MEKNFSPVWLFQFQQLLEVGSFTETALKLKLSQQALSKNIQALEAWAGQDLLTRLPGHLELTPAGALLSEAVPELLQSLQKVNRRVHTPVSTVNIGSAPLWNSHFLPESLLPVLRTWPELDLQVSPLWEQDITAFLLAGELDLGLLLHPPGLGVKFEALPEVRWALVASPELDCQLKPFPYLVFVYSEAPLPDHVLEHLPQPAQCVGQIGTWTVLRQLLLAGVGAAYVLWPYVSQDLHSGLLVELEAPAIPSLKPHAVWLEGHEPHPAARELLDLLQVTMRL